LPTNRKRATTTGHIDEGVRPKKRAAIVGTIQPSSNRLPVHHKGKGVNPAVPSGSKEEDCRVPELLQLLEKPLVRGVVAEPLLATADQRLVLGYTGVIDIILPT
jgi:hypothetical protein